MSKQETAPAIAWTLDDASRHHEDYGFNCGPAAICGALDITPDFLRPYLLDFPQKRYTNPSLMLDILRALGASYKIAWTTKHPRHGIQATRNALLRIQWGGPWLEPGAHPLARYRFTHWIARRDFWIFDINNLLYGPAWMSAAAWALAVVPDLLGEIKRSDGSFFVTHCIEVERPERFADPPKP